VADDWRTVASGLHRGRADLNAAHVAGRLRHGPPLGGRLADGCVTPASQPGGSQRCTRGGALTTRTAFWRTIGGRLRHACITAGRISTLHTWRGAYDMDRLLADDWRTVASRLHRGRADLNAAHRGLTAVLPRSHRGLAPLRPARPRVFRIPGAGIQLLLLRPR
jgi:hypothetical protein